MQRVPFINSSHNSSLVTIDHQINVSHKSEPSAAQACKMHLPPRRSGYIASQRSFVQDSSTVLSVDRIPHCCRNAVFPRYRHCLVG